MTEFKITAESLEAAKKHFKESAQIPGKSWSTCFSESLDALFVPRDEGEGWEPLHNSNKRFEKYSLSDRFILTYWHDGSWTLCRFAQQIATISGVKPAEAQAWADGIIMDTIHVPNDPDTCCAGGLILSDDHTHWTCDKCGKVLPMLDTPVESRQEDREDEGGG